MNKRLPMLLSIVSLCVALALPGFVPAQGVQAATANGKAEVIAETHHDVSAPLRTMAATAGTPSSSAPRTIPLRRRSGGNSAQSNVADPVLQSSLKGPTVGTTAGLNFEGVDDTICDCTPPDTNGAVGATQYVQWVNTAFAVYNKTTGAVVLTPTAGNTLWSGFPGDCATNNDGDPIVLYDHLANRWFFTQFSVSGPGTYQECVAVSTTSDATGTYYRYAFPYLSNEFNDYPKAGVWPDGYYITYNIFDNGNAFLYAKACAFNRTAMLAGTTATQQCFNRPSDYSLLPSDLDGATAPPTGSPNFLLELDGNNTSLDLFKFHVDWTTPGNSTFTGPTNIPVAAFSPACGGGICIPQKGVTQQLDSLADRLMYRLAYRNFGGHESLVVNHSVTAFSSPAAVRWYELRNPNGAVSVYQQGTYGGDGTSRWMGSIAMDKSGDMALGYSISSGTLYPSIAYTGRLAGDTLGTMQAESLIKAGAGSELSQSRWGDYSAMSLDPTDDCTFFYTQEYWKATGDFSWSTQIASFKFPSCGTAAPPPTPTGLHASGATTTSVTFSWTNVDPTANVTVSDGTTATPLPAGTTSFTRTGVALGSYVCLSISAWNAYGASAWSPWSCGLTVPVTPTSLHVSGATNTGISFAWTDPDSHSAIALGVGTSSGPAVYHGFVPGTTTYTQPVPAGYWACAQVAAYNTSYASAFSPWTCGLAVPNAPTAIHVVSHTTSSVTFGWTDSDPYSGIAVSNGSTVSTVAPGGTTYMQSGMTSGSWVCVSLAAYNSAGASPWTGTTTGWVCGQAVT